MAEIADLNCISEFDLCFDPCCAFDWIDLLISGYKCVTGDRLMMSISNLSSFKECVYGTKSKIVNGKVVYIRHSHQRQISSKILDKCAAAIEFAFKDVSPSSFQNFEQLFQFVKDNRPKKGFKQLCTYDTSLRIAGSSNGPLPKDYVYLHCGALRGAQSLWLIDQLFKNLKPNKHKPIFKHPKYPNDDCIVPRTEFCDKFLKLSAADIEDFLCVCHPLLKGMYLQSASKM